MAKTMSPGQPLAEATGGAGEAVAKAGSPLLGAVGNLMILSATLELASDKPKPGDDVKSTIGPDGQTVAKKDSPLLQTVAKLGMTMAALQVLDNMKPGQSAPTTPKVTTPKSGM